MRKIDLLLILSEAGGFLVLGCLLFAKFSRGEGDLFEFAMIGGLAGGALLVIAWSLRKGNVRRTGVTDMDIVISSKEIRIGDRRFLVEQIECLDFLVNSYCGMTAPALILRRRAVHNGEDNKLYFTSEGKQYAFGFYLEDKIAMHRLGLLFREFYKERIYFRERNRGGRTFLFEQVTDRDAFEEAKRSEGYA